MAAIVIHREKFTGNSRDWKDAKTEIVTAIANDGCTFVMDAGSTLFSLLVRETTVTLHQEKTCEKFIPYGMSSYPVQKWYNFIPSNCHFIPN